MGRTYHPPTPHSSGSEYLPGRVNAQRSIGHSFLKRQFGQRLFVILIKSHALVHIVFDDNNLGVFFEDGCEARELWLTEHLSTRIVRSVDDEQFGLRVEWFLEQIKVDNPFILFARTNSFFDPLYDFLFCMLCRMTNTLFLGFKGMPMVWPPAIWTWGR